MNPWAQLLDVQDVDSALDRIEYRRARLEEKDAVADLETRRGELAAKTAEVEADRHRLQRELKRIEDEVALVQEKKSKAEGQLYGGGSSDAGLLQDLQDEIAMFDRQITAHEDDELDVMEALEPVEAELETLRTEAAALDEQYQAALVALAEAEAELDAERDALVATRGPLVDGIDADTLAAYDKTRARFAGIAVARLEGGVCKACNMKLSAVEYDRILHLDPSESVECEDCGRFLVRV